MTNIVQDRWKERRGLAADLAAVNEVPLEGERILELDTGKEKIGDGFTHYNDLPYASAGRIDVTGLADHDALLWDEASGLWRPAASGGGGSGGGSATALIAAIEADSPTHWWQMNETSGTTLADDAGSGGTDLVLQGSNNIVGYPMELVDGQNCFLAAPGVGNGAIVSGGDYPVGMPPPWNYDWSVCLLTRWNLAGATSTNSVCL